MNLRFLLLLTLWMLPVAAVLAQTTPPTRRPAPLPTVPETAWQPQVSSTHVAAAPARTRFAYQQIRVINNETAFLAPAWRGITRLEPDVLQTKRRSETVEGSLDAKILQTINDLAQEGWELLEVYNVTKPTRVTQNVETSLTFNDPNRPTYTGSTSIQTYTETRYLLRRPLAK